MVDIKPTGNEDDILKEANAAQSQPKQDEAQQPSGDPSPSVDTVIPVTITPTSQPIAKPVYPDPKTPTQRVNDQERNIARAAGYTYRLPRGVYLLVFLYVQVVAAYALSFTLSFLTTSSSIFTSSPIQGYPVFIAPLIAAMLVAFMLSGNSMLRIGAIVLSAGTGVYLAVMMGRVIYALTQLGAPIAGAFGGVTFALVAVVSIPIIALLFTAGYLLKSDVARAYS